MRRRRLLTALAAGGLGAVAGCGYAYGGGDLRGEDSIYPGGFGTTRWVLADDRIAVANSGRHFGHERRGFTDGTSVTVADLTGNELWRHTHWEHSVAVAGVDPVYLLDEAERIVAIATALSDEVLASVERGTADGEELWRVTVADAAPPLVRDDRGAYVAVEEGAAAVRDGSVAWRAPLPGVVESLHVADGALVAVTEAAIVALDPSGDERWRRDVSATATHARVATTGNRVAIYDGAAVTVVESATGERSWAADVDGPAARPAASDELVYVVERSELRAFDAMSGDPTWECDAPVGLEFPLVSAPEGVYAMSGGCRAVALDGDGTRWTRELSVGNCDIVGGWLDGERVAFLFESGAIRWLQRTDQDPGLL